MLYLEVPIFEFLIFHRREAGKKRPGSNHNNDLSLASYKKWCRGKLRIACLDDNNNNWVGGVIMGWVVTWIVDGEV